jgi:predicted RNA binding protein YcfA (HicA-like mRNA interferase family)
MRHPNSRDLAKVLERLGFVFVHGKGSHMTFKKEGWPKHVTIYVTDEMPERTLNNIIKQSGASKEEFMRLLDELR